MPLLHEAGAKVAKRTERRRVVVAGNVTSRRQWLVNALNDWGYEAIPVCDHASLVMEIAADDRSTVIMDSDFDNAGRLSALGQLWLEGFAPRVVILSDDPSHVVSERAMRMGAVAALQTSTDLQPLRKAVASATACSALRWSGGSPLLGNSPAIREMRDLIRSVADSDAAVMIIGESGTGKELVARAIHDCSRRATEEYVPVNMAALPDTLVESVLFGYEKGAFTGADQRQEGMCQHADGGTLFLDEIGEMNRELQPKLLRFLQNHTVQRVGSTHVQRVNARIVSATNRNVQELVEQGVLREDLFFRLHVIPIHVPPLRERQDDIPLLANAFLNRKCQEMRRQLTFSSAVLKRLCEYTWPGNIRQLENLIERMVVTTKSDVISTDSLPSEWFSSPREMTRDQKRSGHFVTDLEQPVLVNDRQLTRMESAERQLIVEALHHHDGNVCAVARFLGLGPATVYRKMRSLEITKDVVCMASDGLMS